MSMGGQYLASDGSLVVHGGEQGPPGSLLLPPRIGVSCPLSVDAFTGGLPIVSHVAFQAAVHDAFQVWDTYFHISFLGVDVVFARTNPYPSVEKNLDTEASDCGAGLSPHSPGFVWHPVGRVDVPGSLFWGLSWREVSRYFPAPGPRLIGLEFTEPWCPVQVRCLGVFVSLRLAENTSSSPAW